MLTNKTFAKKAMFFLILMGWFAAVNAMAQVKFGLRAGATLDPDQFHFGAHLITDPLFENFRFRPNLELGVGSHVFTTAANFEFAYEIPFEKKPYGIYVGMGPALVLYDTDAHGGLNILFGFEHQNGFMGEFKAGVIDSPDIKFTFGYTFH